MKKGLMKGGGKKGLLGTEDRPVPSTSTGIAVTWMTHHDWEFPQVGQLLKWFKSMQVPTQSRWRL